MLAIALFAIVAAAPSDEATTEARVQRVVRGLPFPTVMRGLVLDPLGMADSTYEQPLPADRAAAAATAHPWKSRPLPGRWHVYPEMAAAGRTKGSWRV